MDSFGKEFLLSFVPILVAIDALGTLPVLLGIIETSPRAERLRVINVALLTALVLGLAFLFLGRSALRFMDIEVQHFAIAGGLVLLALAIRDMIGSAPVQQPERRELMAVVPIGTPLTVGPATLATLLLLSDQYSVSVVVLAFVANLALSWLVFAFGNHLAGFLGQGGLRAVSKIAHLLLAAIAVRLVVEGVRVVFDIGAS